MEPVKLAPCSEVAILQEVVGTLRKVVLDDIEADRWSDGSWAVFERPHSMLRAVSENLAKAIAWARQDIARGNPVRERKLEEAIKAAQHLAQNYGYASDQLERIYDILAKGLE